MIGNSMTTCLRLIRATGQISPILCPEDDALPVTADHRARQQRAAKRNGERDHPGPQADWLAEQRIAQQLQIVSQRVVIDDKTLLRLKQVRLPQYRRDEEQD